MSAFVDRLVKESSLSAIFANQVVRRAVSRSGVDPNAAQPGDLDRILPELERALTLYLGAGPAAERCQVIRQSITGRR